MYLQREIFCIVAAPVTPGKITKVTAPHVQKSIFMSCPGPRGRSQPVVYNHLGYNQPMSDPVSDHPVPPTPHPAAPPQPVTNPATEFHIGEEFGTARRNLPPAGIVLICIAAVAVVVGIFALRERPKPQGAGAIDLVTAAEVPGQNMILAAITLTLRNTTDKPLWIHTVKAQLTTADGKAFDDEAASAVDLDRYYQAFPALKESFEPPLSPETKLLAGTERRGTIIVGFKITKETFDQRTSLTVTIQLYDQVMPVVLK